MKALVLTAPCEFNYDIGFPDPTPGAGEVLVKIKACGICGSDIHGMDGRSGRRQMPIVMGHEAAGEIIEVGEGVTDWKVGERVTFDSTEYCGECEECQAGYVNLCPDRKVLGVSPGSYRRHGCFAEKIVLPERILYRIPEALPFEKAAFAEPVAIALHAVNLADGIEVGEAFAEDCGAGCEGCGCDHEGEEEHDHAHDHGAEDIRGGVAVVVGAGLIGLLVVQSLKARGWERVIAVDLDDKRLELAKTLGADDAFNAKQEGLAMHLRDICGGDGADASFEVVGAAAPIDLAIRCVRKGGQVVLIGNLQPSTPFPLQEVVTRQITLKGSCSCAGEYPEAIRRIEDGSIQVEPLLSAVAPLQDGADWFKRLYDNKEGLLKVVLTPEA
ncbi:Threonine dehydrogenase [Prosthecobacter debontii]|uniref:Threonine dehydrogenase n=1 Tax=Prosthecobacter debontii TaxID=48467 RepID=A0A1T4YK42_9BACT|nr:galactitol-1-phosphate 5-dehydrogenase [Prosthecobacter debontii]SKB02204.1 Threonine dehydrogenase [Prosthecobacter debontii]